MANLASAADLEDRLGRDLTTAEAARVAALLADASASVRGYTGQTIEQATTTARFRVRRGRVLLAQRPVTAVTAVRDKNGNDLAHEWDGFDRVRVSSNLDSFSFFPWSSPVAVVDVTYTHGYATVPDDIVAVVCSVVTRALGVDPTTTSVNQQVAGPFSATTGSAGSAGGLGLLPGERDVLDRYRLTGGFVQMGPM